MGKYQSYKSSDIEWIGEIPEHWGITKIKHISDGTRNSFIDGDWIESKDLSDDGIRYITSGNIGEGSYKEQGSGYISEVTFDKLNCTELFEGDLIISRLFIPVGRSCILPNLNKRVVTCVDNVVLRPKSDLNKYFLNYQFNSKRYSQYTEILSRGVTLTRISRGMLGNIQIVFPPLHEQEQIVKYLDEKTSIIDKLISTKERKIELLKEQRTSLINEVITKGLNPNIKMKDSGVEWIGEIPEGWKFIPLKYFLEKNRDSIRTGPFGSTLKSTDITESGVRVYNQRMVYDENFDKSDVFISEEKFQTMSSFIVLNGDILISSRGTIGRMTIVPNGSEIGVLHPCLIRIRVDEGLVNKRFLWWYMNQSSIFLESVKIESNSTTIDVIYSNVLSEIKFPIPLIIEQEQIVEYLDKHTKEIDDLVGLEQRKIELLKEYRQSLISEVITGKIKVVE